MSITSTVMVEEIERRINKQLCFWCGGEVRFQTWQYYNINSPNKDKHELCGWCSEKCVDTAFNSEGKISNTNPGKHHRHKQGVTCFGEFRRGFKNA